MPEQLFAHQYDSEVTRNEQLLFVAMDLLATREPRQALYQAFTNTGIVDQPSRVELFAKLFPELQRRIHRREQVECPLKIAQPKSSTPFSQRGDLIAESRGLQQRHPRDAWDPNADEDAENDLSEE